VPDLVRRIDALIRADSARWRIAPIIAWLLLTLPILGAMGIALAAGHPRLFHFLIDEDHVIEWTQFFSILAASFVFLAAGWTAWRLGRLGLAAVFLLVAAASFIVAGEEISWGQRVLHFGTPTALEDVNHQGEANIHNILPIQRAFNYGELLVGLVGFVLPLLWLSAEFRDRARRWLDPLLVPPLCTITLFFLPFAYRSVRATVLQDAGERITEFGEWPELTFYVGVLVCGWLILRRLRRQGATAIG
jgi:hypothetical protein